jgi:hypothetical protein
MRGGIMRRSGIWWFAVVGLALTHAAAAQVIWDMPNVIDPKPKFETTPTIKPRADVWPRLDPGAVLCKTEDDLLRLAASRRGEQVATPNCQMIRTPTAVQIQRRAGLGRTQVSLTDQNGIAGWTDAWLPDRAPPIGGKAIQIR